jgi:hypothetical protein
MLSKDINSRATSKFRNARNNRDFCNSRAAANAETESKKQGY